MLFYFSNDSLLPIYAFVSMLILLTILVGPVLVFYWVFRNSSNKETDYKFFDEHKKWLGLICAVFSLITIVVAKGTGLLESGFAANRLIFTSMIVNTLAFVIGVVSLPRWQGVLTIAIFCFVWSYIFL